MIKNNDWIFESCGLKFKIKNFSLFDSLKDSFLMHVSDLGFIEVTKKNKILNLSGINLENFFNFIMYKYCNEKKITYNKYANNFILKHEGIIYDFENDRSYAVTDDDWHTYFEKKMYCGVFKASKINFLILETKKFSKIYKENLTNRLFEIYKNGVDIKFINNEKIISLKNGEIEVFLPKKICNFNVGQYKDVLKILDSKEKMHILLQRNSNNIIILEINKKNTIEEIKQLDALKTSVSKIEEEMFLFSNSKKEFFLLKKEVNDNFLIKIKKENIDKIKKTNFIKHRVNKNFNLYNSIETKNEKSVFMFINKNKETKIFEAFSFTIDEDIIFLFSENKIRIIKEYDDIQEIEINAYKADFRISKEEYGENKNLILMTQKNNSNDSNYFAIFDYKKMEIIKESNSNLLLCYEKRNIDYLMETTEGEMAKNYLLKIVR